MGDRISTATAPASGGLRVPTPRPPADSRRRALCRIFLAAILLAVPLLAGSTRPASAARPLITGISGVYSDSPFAYQQAQSTGAKLVRISVYWPGIAPNSAPSSWQPEDPTDPNYDWEFTDRSVTAAVQAGLTPVLLVDGVPSWAQRCEAPPVLPDAICDPDPAALAAFATAAARRYSGAIAGLPRVRYWQGLNEPNLSLFFFPQFNTVGRPLSPALYRRLINVFYSAVKSVSPSNLVLLGGLGPIAVPKWTIGPMRFLQLLLCMKGTVRPRPTHGGCHGGVHFDILDIHPYTTGGPTHKGGVDDVELGDLGKLQTFLRAADQAGRIKGSRRRTDLWNTEFSWDSKPPDPGGLPMKILTRWTAEALYRSWQAGLDHFFWFSLEDSAHPDGSNYSETLESGLFFRSISPEQDQPKQVLSAFRFPFVAYPRKKGLTFWGRTPTSSGGRVSIQIWDHGRWRGVGRTKANSVGIFQGRLETHYGRDKHGLARALYKDQEAVPFSMRPVKDFRQPPFG